MTAPFANPNRKRKKATKRRGVPCACCKRPWLAKSVVPATIYTMIIPDRSRVLDKLNR